MSKLDNLLSRLEKVKRTGKDSYIASCCAHLDKSPSLAIREIEPDKLLLHCFAGCSVEEITSACGLTLGDIMPDTAPDKFRRPLSVPFNARDVMTCMSSDAFLLGVFIADCVKGATVTPLEASNAMKAAGRLISATRMAGVR